MYRSRKPECPQGHRGFESHPLRQHFPNSLICLARSFSAPQIDPPVGFELGEQACPERDRELSHLAGWPFQQVRGCSLSRHRIKRGEGTASCAQIACVHAAMALRLRCATQSASRFAGHDCAERYPAALHVVRRRMYCDVRSGGYQRQSLAPPVPVRLRS